MKRSIFSLLLILSLLCQAGMVAWAEPFEGNDEEENSPSASDVVEEEAAAEEESAYDKPDIVVHEEESIEAAETLAEETCCGFGIFEGPTEWIDSEGEEDLLAGFVEQKLNQGKGFFQSSFYAGRRLVSEQPGQASVYFLLKEETERVANAERSSTIFAGPISDLTDYGLIPQTCFLASELGYETIDETNINEVILALLDKTGLKGITPAMRALLADCPYELYWFNKTSSGGYTYSFQYYWDQNEAGDYYIGLTEYTFRLAVAQKYAVAKYEATTEYADSVNAAIGNAREIAAAAEEYTDVGKLEYYLEQICQLTSYNYAAAHGGLPYGDPWQIIYVFDGDPSTKVVCEGYAKAFAYLCELSQFRGSVEWYTVSGRTTENHMWNIVDLNGNNFLVDVTNCDDGGIGQGKQLFLVGYDEGSVEEGYTFRCRTGSIHYQYDSVTLGAFGKPDLNLVPRGTDPRAPVKNGLTQDSDGVWRYYDRNVFVPFTGIAEYRGGWFFVANGVLCSEANGLNSFQNDWYYLSQGKIQDQYTGLALYNGAWFYIAFGILNTEWRGLLDYNGGQFLVSAGQIRRDVSGLWHNDAETQIGGDDAWYYLSGGQVQNRYTGLVQYGGEWFYVINGKLAEDYTGPVIYGGHEFWVVNGQVVF